MRNSKGIVLDIPVNTTTLSCNCVPISGTSNRDMVMLQCSHLRKRIKISVLNEKNFCVSSVYDRKNRQIYQPEWRVLSSKRQPAMDGRRDPTSPHIKSAQSDVRNSKMERRSESAEAELLPLQNRSHLCKSKQR